MVSASSNFALVSTVSALKSTKAFLQTNIRHCLQFEDKYTSSKLFSLESGLGKIVRSSLDPEVHLVLGGVGDRVAGKQHLVLNFICFSQIME